MNIEKGDKVKVSVLFDGKYMTFLGLIEDIKVYLLKKMYTVSVLPKKEVTFDVRVDQIIDVVDIHREGYPEEYIKDFIMCEGKNRKEILTELFTQGMCYLFADWLHKRLLFSKIVYVREEHHYVVLWDNKLYDISGDVTEKYKDCTLDEHKFEGDWKDLDEKINIKN
jgi:hypothetical protein